MENKKIFQLTPMGGLGEIGSNMLLAQIGSVNIVIDVGILFPNLDAFNINYVIPDFNILDNITIDALIITHAHEDHIGAINHLLQHSPPKKIYCPQFAKYLIIAKSESASPLIKTYENEDVIDFQTIKCKFFHVNHSIPDTFSLLFYDDKNSFCLYYASDFKIHKKDYLESSMNLSSIKKDIKNYKKKIFMTDSTNIVSKGRSTSEQELIPSLEKVITQNERVFITLFPSNIFRLRTICDIAKKEKCKIYCLGLSIKKYILAATKINPPMLDEKDFLFDFKKIPNEKCVVLVSGSQGDFFGALRRLSDNEDKSVIITEGDTLVFSSKTIPGNELKINSIYNKLGELGVKIIDSRDLLIHASGHAYQEDLRELYQQLEPTDVIPIHGTSYFLKKHQEFIKENFPSVSTYSVKNYDKLILDNDLSLSIEEGTTMEPTLIHGRQKVIEQDGLRERKKIAMTGLCHISLNKNNKNVSVTLIGLPEFIKNKKSLWDKELSEQWKRSSETIIEKVQEDLKVEIRRKINHLVGYKPYVSIELIN